MSMLLKFWRELALVLLLIALGVLGRAYLGEVRRTGDLARQVKVEQGAVKILATNMVQWRTAAQQRADDEAEEFAKCQDAAAGSESTAFDRGVMVGKIIGRRDQCNASSPSASWPVQSPPAAPLTRAPS